MKGNLSGFIVSGIIHLGLLFIVHSVASQPLLPEKKPVPVQLSMFQEVIPESVKPVEVKPVIENKPKKEAVKKELKPESVKKQEIIKKPETKKAKKIAKKRVKKKRITKKISNKKRVKKKPEKKKIVKKKQKKMITVAKRDKTLDQMINALKLPKKKKVVQKKATSHRLVRPATTQPASNAREVNNKKVTRVNRVNGRPQRVTPRPVVKPRQPVRSTNRTLARRPVQHKSKPVYKPAPAHPNDGVAEQSYRATLNRFIASHKHYPARARRRQETGTVTVSFVIYKNGNVQQVAIKKSSGSRTLDQAAINLIRKLSGKFPFPATLRRSQWSLSLSIVYHLN